MLSSISSLVWSTPKEYMNHSVWGQGSNWSSSCVVCSITFRNLRCTVVKLGRLDTIRRRWLHVIKPLQTKNILLLHWIVLKFYICWIPSEDEHLQFFFQTKFNDFISFLFPHPVYRTLMLKSKGGNPYRFNWYY